MKKGDIRLAIIGLVSFFLCVISLVATIGFAIGAVAKEAGDMGLGEKIDQGIQTMSEMVMGEDGNEADY